MMPERRGVATAIFLHARRAHTVIGSHGDPPRM